MIIHTLTTQLCPRVRADRPAGLQQRQPRRRCPPRTRGSTPVTFYVAECDLVPPAYARIDPSHVLRRRVRPGAPRVRADRPRMIIHTLTTQLCPRVRADRPPCVQTGVYTV